MFIILIELIHNDNLLNGDDCAGEFIGWEHAKKGAIIKYKENNKIIKQFRVIKTKLFFKDNGKIQKIVLKVDLELIY